MSFGTCFGFSIVSNEADLRALSSLASFSSLGNLSQAAQRAGEGSITQPATTGAFGQPLAGASSTAQQGGASSNLFGAFGSTQSNQPAQQQGQAGGSNIFGASPFGGSSTAISGGLTGGTGFGGMCLMLLIWLLPGPVKRASCFLLAPPLITQGSVPRLLE